MFSACSYSPRAAKGLPRPSSPPPSSLLMKPCSSLLHLYPHVFEMLYCLGPYMHSDPVLLAKMIRLGRSFMKDSSKNSSSRSSEDQSDRVSRIGNGHLSLLSLSPSPSLSLPLSLPHSLTHSLIDYSKTFFIIYFQEKVFQGFISLLDEVILPSLSLLPCNCGMTEELWAMIKFLPYERRYRPWNTESV